MVSSIIESNTNSGWGSLPWPLLEDILDKVKTQQDYLEFELVCASWNQVAMTEKLRSRLNTLAQIPMLLVPSKENRSHSLYNVVTRRFSNSKLVVPYHGRFGSFSRGWLVGVHKNNSVTLYKAYPTVPTDNKDDVTAPTIIRLPIIHHNDSKNCIFDYRVRTAVISADPITNPDKCVVMVVFGTLSRVVFIRPNKDTRWTYLDFRTSAIHSLFYRNDQFYAVNRYRNLLSFKVTDDPVNYAQDVKQVTDEDSDRSSDNLYLAESQGELVLVRRVMYTSFSPMKGHITRKTYDLSLHELDAEKGEWVEWVEMENSSDTVLFLGDNNSISISRSDFPRFKLETIYLTHDFDLHLSTQYGVADFGAYDLDNGMERRFGMDKTTVANIFPRIPIWYVPNAR